jgi:hypothetical protein
MCQAVVFLTVKLTGGQADNKPNSSNDLRNAWVSTSTTMNLSQPGAWLYKGNVFICNLTNSAKVTAFLK